MMARQQVAEFVAWAERTGDVTLLPGEDELVHDLISIANGPVRASDVRTLEERQATVERRRRATAIGNAFLRFAAAQRSPTQTVDARSTMSPAYAAGIVGLVIGGVVLVVVVVFVVLLLNSGR